MFDKITNHTKVSLTCKNLRQLPRGKYVSQIECAPSTSLHVILDNDQYGFRSGFIRSGFVCHNCVTSKRRIIHIGCKNCSLCPAGTYIYNDENHCLECFAGGFYQDEMGQIECKRCSNGTFVSERRSPGTKATDCVACPYGKGILHVKSIWKYITFNPIRCFIFLRQGVSRLKNRVIRRTGTSDEFPHLIEESN